MLDYFLQILLEKAQSLTGINRIHKVVAWGRHHLESEKREERLRYMKVGNS